MKNLKHRNKSRFFSLMGFLIGGMILLLYPFTLIQAPVVNTANPEIAAREIARESQIDNLRERITSQQEKISFLKRTFEISQPQKPYLVVNSSANTVKLLKAGKILHQGQCSTGSYILLIAKGQRQWLFKTPRGLYRVTVKLKDPWWYKPDWAYVEEDLPIPSKYSAKRYQPGVLGDYALGFGNGYLIHGTLYKRFLGMPVTHGCVRLGDDDMKLVFSTLNHGSRIYIY